MPRSGAGLDLCKSRTIGNNRPLFNIQSVNHNLVDSEVGYKGKAVVRADVDGMRMGPLLAPKIHAGTGVLHKAGRLSESAVRFDRNHRGAPAAVVGDEHVPSRMVDADVAGPGTA